MVIVSARIKTTPGKRDTFIEAAQSVIAATRKEEGCLCYELYASTEDKNLLMYFEKWESREALKKHTESAHIKAFMEKRAAEKLQDGQSDLQIFDTV